MEIVVDARDTTRTYVVRAGRAGHRAETAVRRGVVEVSEVTLGAPPGRSLGEGRVRTARSMANRVPELLEQRVPRVADGEGGDPGAAA